jgi:hypothetical protein
MSNQHSITTARHLRDALLMARPAVDHDGAGAVALAQMVVVSAAVKASQLRRSLAEQAEELAATRARFDAEPRHIRLMRAAVAQPTLAAGLQREA